MKARRKLQEVKSKDGAWTRIKIRQSRTRTGRTRTRQRTRSCAVLPAAEEEKAGEIQMSGKQETV